MRYDLHLDGLPAGYSIGYARPGEQVQVVGREFTSSEDGEIFISRLEGWPTTVLSLLPREAGLTPGNADWFVCVIHPDKTASVWTGIRPIAEIRAKRSLKKGEGVYLDDIADIGRLHFEGVEIPPTAGVAVLMSVGWRKGFYFDFEPIQPPGRPRGYDLEAFLGQFFAYLSAHHLFGISDAEWEELISFR
jgi:hypothetical protein